MNRDGERAPNTARIQVGVAVLFTVIAVLQWFSNDDLWVPVLYTLAAVAYASTARGARRQAREAAARTDLGDAGAHGVRS